MGLHVGGCYARTRARFTPFGPLFSFFFNGVIALPWELWCDIQKESQLVMRSKPSTSIQGSTNAEPHKFEDEAIVPHGIKRDVKVEEHHLRRFFVREPLPDNLRQAEDMVVCAQSGTETEVGFNSRMMSRSLEKTTCSAILETFVIITSDLFRTDGNCSSRNARFITSTNRSIATNGSSFKTRLPNPSASAIIDLT